MCFFNKHKTHSLGEKKVIAYNKYKKIHSPWAHIKQDNKLHRNIFERLTGSLVASAEHKIYLITFFLLWEGIYRKQQHDQSHCILKNLLIYLNRLLSGWRFSLRLSSHTAPETKPITTSCFWTFKNNESPCVTITEVKWALVATDLFD